MIEPILDTEETRGIKPNSNWWKNYLAIVLLLPFVLALILFFGEEWLYRIRWEEELFEFMFGAVVLVGLVVGLALSAKFLAQREPRISFWQLTIAALIQLFLFVQIFLITIDLVYHLIAENTLGPVEFFTFLSLRHFVEALIYAGMFQAILGFVIKLWRREALIRYFIFMLIYYALALFWLFDMQYRFF